MVSMNVVEELGFVGGTEVHNLFMNALFFRNEFIKKKKLTCVLSLEILDEKTKTLNYNVSHADDGFLGTPVGGDS